LDVCDLTELITEAHRRGVLVAVDNTTATLLGQQPLAHGADFSVSSDTKALTGHSDLLLGHVATPERLRDCPISRVSPGGPSRALSWTATGRCLYYCLSPDGLLWSRCQLSPRRSNRGRAFPGFL